MHLPLSLSLFVCHCLSLLSPSRKLSLALTFCLTLTISLPPFLSLSLAYTTKWLSQEGTPTPQHFPESGGRSPPSTDTEPKYSGSCRAPWPWPASDKRHRRKANIWHPPTLPLLHADRLASSRHWGFCCWFCRFVLCRCSFGILFVLLGFISPV